MIQAARECEKHFTKIIHVMNNPQNTYQHIPAINNMVNNFVRMWKPDPDEYEPNRILEYFAIRLQEIWEAKCKVYEKK